MLQTSAIAANVCGIFIFNPPFSRPSILKNPAAKQPDKKNKKTIAIL